MAPANTISFILVMSLLVLQGRAGTEQGFNGTERDALIHIKEVLNNPFLNKNWNGLMCYMNDPPYWYGIQCSNGRVTGIILENMDLSAEIKADVLKNLSELVTLSFKNNSLHGSMMEFTYNPKLTNIDLSRNSFSGEIPTSLVYLSSLQSLQLQNNKLSGSIPGLDQNNLKAFNVSYNNLSGAIPETRTLQSFGISSYMGNENLCGPPLLTPCPTIHDVISDNSSQKGSNGSQFVAILIAVDAVVLVVILFLFIIYYKKYNKLKNEIMAMNLAPKSEDHDSRIVERTSEKLGTPVRDKGKLVFLDSNEANKFELDDLLKASAEGLGKGNFGNCYKAMLENGAVVVVKRLRDLKPLNSEEFVRQVRAIGEQKHPNLLPLLAYYYSKDEKLFLYRYASHGNLFNRLHGGRGTRDRVPFRWSSRLTVARSVARALHHLHMNTRSSATAPHGNLKSTNVLLNDDSSSVFVMDYGLTSLIALPVAANRMVVYKSPEYFANKQISKKSDVWSYGCFLLELLSGKIPSHSAPQGTNSVDLCAWVHRAVREEWTAEIFDPEIAVQRGANDGMLKLMRIAMRCCEKAPEKRPEIGEVLPEVEEIYSRNDGSEEDGDYEYSSIDRSLTDDSFSSAMSGVGGDDRR